MGTDVRKNNRELVIPPKNNAISHDLTGSIANNAARRVLSFVVTVK